MRQNRKGGAMAGKWAVRTLLLCASAVLVIAFAQGARGDDLVQQEDEGTPKRPGCDNDFVLVSVASCSVFASLFVSRSVSPSLLYRLFVWRVPSPLRARLSSHRFLRLQPKQRTKLHMVFGFPSL